VKYFFSTLLLISSILLSAQDFHFKQISLKDGLAQSSINAVTQDLHGFMWFGTEDGLNRFDGNEFVIYKNIPFDSTSLSENFITALLVDSKNQLWVGTMNEGLHLFDSETQTFKRFYYSNNENALSNNNINTIYEDKNGRVWIGTSNGLNLIVQDKKDISFQRFQYNSDFSKGFPEINFINKIFNDSKNQLWVGTAKGLFQFEIEIINKKQLNLNQKNHFIHQENNPNSLSDNNIRAIEEDEKNYIWIGTVTALQRFKNDIFEQIKLKEKSKKESINDLLINKKGELLIATFKGIFIIDHKDDDYKPMLYEHSNNGVNSLHDNMIISIFEDKNHEGLYWLGTYLSGIGQMYERKKRFVTNYLKDTKLKEKIGASVHLIAKQNDILWLSTTSGLLRYDRKNEHYQLLRKFNIINYNKNNFKQNAFYHNWITTIFKDDDNQIWLGSRLGLLKLIEKNNQFSVELFQNESEAERAVFGIHQVGKKLYLGGVSGINIFDLEKQNIEENPIVIDTINNKEFGYQIRFIHKDKKQNWWIGTTHGLVFYESVKEDFWEYIKTNKGTVYQHNPNNENSLVSDRITAICEDKDGNVWLGTHSGLVKVTIKKSGLKFRFFSEKDGLANSLVYTVINDEKANKNYLWLSTNRGLSRFDISNSNFANFDIKDGLQSNEFNGNSFYQADDGELIFGGINGYTSFYPDEIKLETNAPKVFITTLKTSKKTYNLLNQKSIELAYINNSFSVQFNGLDFIYPSDMEYFYRLEGRGDERLISLGNSRQVNFTELGSGTYTLHVLAKNRDGAMQNIGDFMAIKIAAPFWQTWWFILLSLLLFAFLLWSIYHIRYLDKMRKLAEIERVRKNAAQDFHDELGSKLTIISMFTELTKSKLDGKNDTVAPYLDKVSDTAGSLYHSMKDLIWALNPEQDTLQDLFLQLKDFGDELFDQTGVEFQSTGIEQNIQNQKIPMECKRHVLLIFKELMNNALKHSDCSAVCLNILNEKDGLKISLKDNGSGFNPSDEYDGDGLKNIYSRANKIDGKISVCSNNRGTEVVLACGF
jgi:ligand-binding sensor domain-containing protein/signal transduction histidine kinase